MNVLTGKIAAELRQLAAFAGVFISISDTIHLPGNLRAILLAASSTILAVEHAVNGVNSAKVDTGAASVSTGQV